VRVHYVSRGSRTGRMVGLMLLGDALGVGAGYGAFRGVGAWGGLELGLLLGLAFVVQVNVVGFIRLAKNRPAVSLDFSPRAAGAH